MSHVDPLPEELAQLTRTARAAHRANQEHVDSLIRRLERARDALTTGEADAGTPGDELLSLGSYLKTSNAESAQRHKDWGNAVNKLAKSVDRKYGAPPAPLFPPPPPSTTTAAATSLEETLLLRRRAQPQPAAAATEPDQAQRLPFSNPEAIAALNETIAIHLARIGAFHSLSNFLAESHTPQPPSLTPELLSGLKQLHEILERIRQGDCTRAIEWVEEARRAAAGDDADADSDELLFQLRKEEYIRLVLAAATTAPEETEEEEDEPMTLEPPRQQEQDHNGDVDRKDGDGADHPTVAPGTSRQRRKSSLASMSSSILRTSSSGQHGGHGPVNPHLERALAYGGQHFRPLVLSSASSSGSSRTALVCSLLTSPLYLPLDRLLSSPYGSLYAPYLASSSSSSPTTTPTTPASLRANEPLLLLFTEAYLRALSLPKNSPLTVVTDVGGSGALAKIIKVRTVMKEKKTEWSAVGELPVEIPLPLPYRYHSIFACPVSKEQSTAQNPPMLLPCGHVIARESLMRLARGTPTLKCPYCPVVSHFNACVRVHF